MSASRTLAKPFGAAVVGAEQSANCLAHTFDTRQPRFAARQRLHTFRIGRVPMVIGKRDERFEGGRGARRGDVFAIIENRAVG